MSISTNWDFRKDSAFCVFNLFFAAVEVVEFLLETISKFQ